VNAAAGFLVELIADIAPAIAAGGLAAAVLSTVILSGTAGRITLLVEELAVTRAAGPSLGSDTTPGQSWHMIGPWTFSNGRLNSGNSRTR
jgi:hypothetical protein